MARPVPADFNAVLADAVRYFADRGYQSADDVALWVARLRQAAEDSLLSEQEVERQIKASLGGVFDRFVTRGKIAERVQGVGLWTIERVRPALRAELDRRILAAANQIKLNRVAAIEKSLQRFAGWSTSIPAGGTEVLDRREVKGEIGKSIAQIRYEARRVAIDQGHKLIANVSEIVALDGGAIAAIWHDRGEHDPSYNARKEHLARSGKIFLVRDSWAIRDGLVRRGSRPYTDEIERPAEAVYCSCFYEWITALRRLPAETLTAKGRAALSGNREAA